MKLSQTKTSLIYTFCVWVYSFQIQADFINIERQSCGKYWRLCF